MFETLTASFVIFEIDRSWRRQAPAVRCRPVRHVREHKPRRRSRVSQSRQGQPAPDQRARFGSAARPRRSARAPFARSASGVAQGSVVAALVLSSENDPQAARERVDGLQCGIDIGRFRIVVVFNAIELLTNSMRCSTPGNESTAAPMLVEPGSRKMRNASGAAITFSTLCRPRSLI